MADFPFRPIGGLSGGLADYFKKQPRLDIYTGNDKKIWWRIYMSSDIVAASSQGYATRALCIDNLKRIANHIVELDKSGKLI